MTKNLYTPAEDDFMRDNYATMSNAEIGRRLGRTTMSVVKRISKLKLKRPSPYTPEEDEFLKENHQTMTHAELAEALGKNTDSIHTRLKKLNLKKKKPRYVNKRGECREGYQYILYSDWATMLDTPCPLLAPCQRCKELNPTIAYYAYSTGGKSGFTDILGIKRHSTCPSCNIAKYIAKDERQKMLDNAKSRARRDKRDFALTLDDIVIPRKCPILGIELKAEVGSGRDSNPAENDHVPQLDRIDSSKGYVPGNVCVISSKANIQKKNGTAREFLAICAFLAEARNKNASDINIQTPYACRSTKELVGILRDYLMQEVSYDISS